MESNPGPFEVDFINRQGGASAMVPGNAEAGSATVGQVSTGSIAPGSLGPNASGAALTQSLDFAIDNNNSAGVTGGDGAADQIAALQVTTGMEFSIALADIGSPGLGDRVLISAMINNGDHNFLSNQILGGLEAPQGNLGGDGNGGFTGDLSGVDFNNYGRVQDFKVLSAGAHFRIPGIEPLGSAVCSAPPTLKRRPRLNEIWASQLSCGAHPILIRHFFPQSFHHADHIAAPEPSSLALLAIMGCLVARWRR